MRGKKILISKLLIVAFLFTTVFAQYSTVFAASIGKSKPKKEKVQLLVKYKDDNKSEDTKSKVKSKLKLGKLDLMRKNKITKSELLQIDENENIDKVVSEFKKDPNVAYAQEDFKLQTSEAPSDERFSEQWGLKNDGQEIQYAKGSNGVDVNAEAAWEDTKGAPSVIVGVLDTGIDINHSDLKDNIYTNTAEVSGNAIDDDGNKYIDDVNGWNFVSENNKVYDSVSSDTHGTHVAGIIAASADSKGIIGVAPNVKILPLKFISDGEGYTSDAIEAIEYAKQMGVKIINCSFGGYDYNAALKDEIASSGILFICAAGNDGSDLADRPVYPAAFGLPNIITVASVDNSGNLSGFSNYGQTVDVAAPGTGILSTIPGDGYNYMSGTSMAAGFVSGTAALIKSEYPDMTAAQLAARIKSSVKPIDSLKGKVASNGIIDAAKALTNTTDSSTTDTTVSDSDKTGSDSSKGAKIETLGVSIPQSLQEQIHYGEQGVNVATGNYSNTFTDMDVNSPGFDVKISRTYNSKNYNTSTSFGPGWTFGFEGNIKTDTSNSSLKDVTLPNGSVQVFVQNSDGTFTANNSHSTLIKQSDGSFVLTTKDQYTYGFNNTGGYLAWMKDINGNAINIQVDTSGKVQKITDSAGRAFAIAYNAQGYITSVTDPMNRVVKYQYDTNNRLSTIIDPNNNAVNTYAYDANGYLTIIKDYFGTAVEQIAYDHSSGSNKVQTYTDIYGNKSTYSYDISNRVTTITDSGTPTPRVIKKWYDPSLYVIKSQDPEGKITTVEYYTDANGYNKYGEEKSITDRNGNKTQYERDANGNITKITNPDGSIKQYTYDSKNNETMEKDESGKCTYSIYDVAGINLIKKVQPLNGTDAYSPTADQSLFAITSYNYFSDSEASQLGYSIKGLLKSEVDSEGNATTYTYDKYGNKKTATDADGNTTNYYYNTIGWLTSEISPAGHKKDYYYDNNGKLEKTVLDNGETTRTVYDQAGRKIQEISANQYDATKEVPNTRQYSDTTAGYRYTYFSNGKLKSELKPEKDAATSKYYETDYTYDLYGNLLTETEPNGAVYSYSYDSMNRQTKVTFKSNSSAAEDTLKEFSYNVQSDCKTTTTEKDYLNSTDTAVTVSTYDYDGKLLSKVSPDGGKISITYNPNRTVAVNTDANGGTTNFKYDGLNRISETWTAIEPGKYMYSATTYYKNGKKKEEKTGKDKVALNSTPSSDRLIVKSYAYYPGGTLQSVTDSSGRKSVYKYDKDGFVSSENDYTASNSYNLIEYDNDQQGKPLTKKVHVKNGDIYGNDFSDNTDSIITTSYKYDKNGNLIKKTAPDGAVTNYTYDFMNRQTSTSKPSIDENGVPIIVATSKTYDWNDKVLSSTDERGNTTSYAYNAKELLVKQTDPNGGVTAFDYDKADRKIAEVSPNSYNASVPISQMDRTVYSYDKLNRIKTVTEYFTEKKIDPATVKWVDKPASIVIKAYKYDLNGNIIKELDGEGYKFGAGLSEDDKINSGYGKEYTFNLANKAVTMLDPVAKERNLTYTTKYDYDGAGRKISETDGNGAVKAYYYDDAGQITSTTIRNTDGSPEQTIETDKYDLLGNLVSKTDGNGNTTTYEYNALGKVRKTIYPSDATIPANTVVKQYDSDGNLAWQKDSMDRVLIYTYDEQGKLLSTTDEKADGSDAITTSTRYDKAGNARYEIDGNGNVKENIYNALNKLIESRINVTAPDGTKILHSTKYDYDKNGNNTTTTDWRGNVTTNIYDSINRLIETVDANGKGINRNEYNADNSQITSWDVNNNATTFGYDRNNMLIATTDPEGNVERQSYNNIGKIAAKTDGNGNITKYDYDQLDRLSTVTNAKGEKTTYTYDNCSNMLTQTDGKGNTTIFEYNAANKLSKKIDAGGRKTENGQNVYNNSKVEKYTYLADGNMASKVDRNGKLTAYEYDIHGRLLSRAIDDQKISYTYDNDGNQLTSADNTGTTLRKYDELGRTTFKSVPGIGTNTYVYDNITNLSAGFTQEISTDAKGNVTTSIYDKVGRLSSILDGGNSSATYEYYDNGNRKNVKYSSGVSESYDYYKDNLVKTLINKKADGSIIDSYSYIYDAAHNQASKKDSKGVTQYLYDELNRVKKITEPNGNITEYTYDSAGNRDTETLTQGTTITITKYQYNEQNRLLSTTKTTGNGSKETTQYGYDNNGNMTSKSLEKTTKIDPANPPTASFGGFIIGQPSTNPRIADIVGGTATYEYDVWNQMIKSSTADGMTVNKYNADGLRVEKTVNDKTTKFLYEGDKVTLELDGKGQQTARNLLGTNIVSRKVDGQTLNYLYNGHADVTALVDGTGVLKSTYYYDAFGNQTSTTGSVNNPYTYSGYQYDKETGLYYLNSRMYDSQTARFMQEDTYSGDSNDPLSLNLYTYCSNNPIMYSDPSGHAQDISGDGSVLDFSSQNKNVAAVFTTRDQGKVIAVVEKAQEQLMYLHYNVGASGADGRLGNNTRKAIIQYQREHGLDPTGMLDNETRSSITDNYNWNQNNAAKSVVSTHKDTNSVSDQNLQNQLSYLHYSDSETNLNSEIRQYQVDHNLSVTGTADSATISSINANYQWNLGKSSSATIGNANSQTSNPNSDENKLITIPTNHGYTVTYTKHQYEIAGTIMTFDAVAGVFSEFAGAFGSLSSAILAKNPNALSDTEGVSNPRIFTSTDPLVGDLATNIEAKFPGKVVDVNKVVRGADGKIITDFDIELDNVIIQVKEGGGKGMVSQLERTATATNKTVIGYGPDLKGSIVKGANAKGFSVFRSEDELMEFLKNLK